MRVCSTPGCPNLTTKSGRCDTCQAQADARRGTPAQRGYGTPHRRRFRPQVLARADYLCELCRRNVATVADHWPLDRRTLVQRGLDPDDPRHGRGLCKQCHDRETASTQPGGWNSRAT